MIRATTLLLLGLSLAACSALPGLDYPSLTAQPQYHLLKLQGRSRMQSAPGGGGLVNNAAMPLTEFGMRKRDDDYGGILGYGDGFSGFEFGYLNVDMDNTDRGVTSADWGAIAAGSTVTSKFSMEEYRLRYIAQVFEYETDDDLMIRLGLGASIAHRDARLTVRDQTTLVSQEAKFRDDGVPYGQARLRGEYRNATLTFDYGYAGFEFGGDYEAPLQDYAITGTYTLEDQDITFLAGFRWLELPTSGTSGGFLYDSDLRLEGFMLGVEVRF